MIVNARTLTTVVVALSSAAHAWLLPTTASNTRTASCWMATPSSSSSSSSSSSWENLAEEWAARHDASGSMLHRHVLVAADADAATQAAAATAAQVADLEDQWQELQQLNAMHGAYDDVDVAAAAAAAVVEPDAVTVPAAAPDSLRFLHVDHAFDLLHEVVPPPQPTTTTTTTTIIEQEVMEVAQPEEEEQVLLEFPEPRALVEIEQEQVVEIKTHKEPSQISDVPTTTTTAPPPLSATTTTTSSLGDLAAEWTRRHAETVDKNNERKPMTVVPVSPDMLPSVSSLSTSSSSPRGGASSFTTTTTIVPKSSAQLAAEWKAMNRPRTESPAASMPVAASVQPVTSPQNAATPSATSGTATTWKKPNSSTMKASTSTTTQDLVKAWSQRNKEVVQSSMPPPMEWTPPVASMAASAPPPRPAAVVDSRRLAQEWTHRNRDLAAERMGRPNHGIVPPEYRPKKDTTTRDDVVDGDDGDDVVAMKDQDGHNQEAMGETELAQQQQPQQEGYAYAVPDEAFAVPPSLEEELTMLREVADSDLFPDDKIYDAAAEGYGYNLGVAPDEPAMILADRDAAMYAEVATDVMNPGETRIDHVEGYVNAVDAAEDAIVDVTVKEEEEEGDLLPMVDAALEGGTNNPVLGTQHVQPLSPGMDLTAQQQPVEDSKSDPAAKWNRAVADAMEMKDFGLTMDFHAKDDDAKAQKQALQQVHAAFIAKKKHSVHSLHTRNLYGGAAATMLATFYGFASLSQPLPLQQTVATADVTGTTEIEEAASTETSAEASEADSFKPKLEGDQSFWRRGLFSG